MDKNIPKTWDPWYDIVLSYYLEGRTAKEIAGLLHKHEETVRRVIKMPDFMAKLEEITAMDRGEALDILKKYKNRLLRNKIQMALNGEKEGTRNEATSWLLERFPELQTKNAGNITQFTYVPTKEEFALNAEAADKIAEVARVLLEGKQNSEEESNEGNVGERLLNSEEPD